MSGFLEQLHASVEALKTEVAGLKAAIAALQSGAAITQQPAAGTGLPQMTNGSGAAADPFAGIGGTQTQQPQQVTDAMVMKLVSDNVGNETIKLAMQGVLAQMGIPRLPEARPDQLPDLYARLSAVVAQHGGAGAATAGGTGLPSIL